MNPSLQEALQHLPHGPGFRFVDGLWSLDPGKQGTGEYRVRGDEAFLAGHFPGNPLFPGVLIVEACAQLAGVVAQSDPSQTPLPGLKLTALRAVKMTGSARPGDSLILHARVLGRMGHLIQTEVSASVAGALVLQGELTLAGCTPAQIPPPGTGPASFQR